MSQLPQTDSEWLKALRDGDDSALNLIMAQWEGPLFAFAWRYLQNISDAQDLVTETFVRLHQQRDKLREDTKLSSWLYTVITHLCHNHHRWRRRHPTTGLDAQDPETGRSLADEIPCAGPLPGHELERKEQIDRLREAIDRLPHELKTTLLLHHYEHLSYKEIAAVTECSERGVETRLYRAKQRLREDLERQALVNGEQGLRPTLYSPRGA